MQRRLLSLLVLLMTVATGAWAQDPITYKVKMKDGTKDAEHWIIEPTTATTDGVAKGTAVTLKYNGRLKVTSVTATHDGWNGDLSNFPAPALESDAQTLIVSDGTTLTGTLDGSTHPYKILIADGATVTLAGVTINGIDDENCKWAGINCDGDATIILADGTTNVVKGFYYYYPGIHVPGEYNNTLTIKGGTLGIGTLTASPFDGGTDDSYASGIGGGYRIECGNIVIEGGYITATGGNGSAGIGSGFDAPCGYINISGGVITAYGSYEAVGIGCGEDGECGDINISGGTVIAIGGEDAAGIGCGDNGECGNITISGGSITATGGKWAAGIGCARDGECGNITITTDVNIVTATKGPDAKISIGGDDDRGCSCGKITIGGTVYYDGTVYWDVRDYRNGGETYLAQSPLTLVNLGKLTGNYEAKDGTTLFGTLDGATQKYKVSIADGATVTLDGAAINGVNDNNCKWAGLNCAGNATIIVKDGSTNVVKGFFRGYPGIHIPILKKLTIKGGTLGDGSLTASPFDGGTDDSYGAGIGGVQAVHCGAIEIQGGIITATGGSYAAGIGGSWRGTWADITISGGKVTANGGTSAAGIGSGYEGGQGGRGKISITGGTVEATGGIWGPGIGSGRGDNDGQTTYTAKCSDITISGGTVTATGGDNAAGIGTGQQYSKCGNITITSGVTKVTATKGSPADNSIGMGVNNSGYHNSCGTVTIEDESKVTQQ